MQLKQKLSPTATRAQRWAATVNPELDLGKPVRAATECTARRRSPFDLLATRSAKPVRIPAPIIAARPVLRGNKSYLRALRAAEMAVWNAGGKFMVSHFERPVLQ